MPDRIYCYPGSDVLRNRLGIRDKDSLLQAEIELASERMKGFQQRPVRGRFNFRHLCGIHKRIFQGLFDIRTMALQYFLFFSPFRGTAKSNKIQKNALLPQGRGES